MEQVVYTTQIKGDQISIPEEVKFNFEENSEVEVVIRPIRRAYPKARKKDEVLREVMEQMEKEFPNLRFPLDQEVLAIVGISDELKKDFRQFSDKDIAGMARMEKYMEKEEIIETLY